MRQATLALATLLLFVPACFDGPTRGSNPTPPPPIVTNDAGVIPGGCGGANDLDGDCVPNAQDQCSRTAAGAAVWKQGAWAGCGDGQFKDLDDGDRDNVPNSKDQCPGTTFGQPVDARGCAAGQQPGGKQDGAPLPTYDMGVSPKSDTSVPKPPDQGTPGVTLTAAELDLVQAINKERLSLGVSAVTVDAKLMCTARLAAKSGTCGHYAGGSWIDRGKKCGLNNTEAWLINEIATGQGFTDGAMAVWGWKSSSGHYWGLKHPQAKTIGVAKSSAGCYWAIFDCCIKGS